MSILLKILIFLYIGFVSVHLFSCFFAFENPRMVTKVFLMPFLSIIYYKATPKEQFSKTIFVGIILGFCGDVILLNDSYLPFILLGIAFFFFGHVMYIINFIIETGIRNYKKYFIFLVIISTIYYKYYKFAFNNLKEGFIRGEILIPGACYMFLLVVLCISSGIYAYTYLNIYAILAHFGTFIFTVSDFILARKMFYEDNKYYQFVLMATYILAQTLICFGMANKKNIIENEKTQKIS